MLIPTTPPTGRLEFLPEDTIAATATRLPKDQLELSVWIPGFSMDLIEGSESSDDDFIDNHCDGCDYYFETYELDSRDRDRLRVSGLPDWADEVISITVNSACPCHGRGLEYVSFPCAAGHDGLGDAKGGCFDGPPMRFDLTLQGSRRRDGELLVYARSTNAWSQAAYVRRGDSNPPELCLSGSDRSLNIHSGGAVCWGDGNSNPGDLASMVEVYAGTAFNDDLMSYSQFHSVCKTMRSSMQDLRSSDGASAKSRRHEFVDGRHAAILVVDPAFHNETCPLLLAMGAEPQGDGLIVLPLMWHDTRAEGTLISPPLGCGVSVLVRPGADNTGIVIGQSRCFSAISPSPVPSPQLAHV